MPKQVRPYFEREPMAAFFLGVSSGFPYAMIGATLTTGWRRTGSTKRRHRLRARLPGLQSQARSGRGSSTACAFPLLGRLGQRVSWLIVAGVLVMAAVANLAFQDPAANILQTAIAAILVGVAGATFDIVIDAYRIELLEPDQLGVGSGMTQYGWRIGSVAAGALALVARRAVRLGDGLSRLRRVRAAGDADRPGRSASPSGTASRPRARASAELWASISGPFVEFFQRNGAWLVLLFILLHKIGDTLGQLVLRLLLDDMGYTNDEIAIYDVGVGFWAYLIGIFVGGMLYAQLGMKRSVLISLILMGVSNASFALLAMAGHTQPRPGRAHGLREFRQRHRRRRRRRLFLGADRPALHRLAICPDLGGGEHRRPVADRHHAPARWSKRWAS